MSYRKILDAATNAFRQTLVSFCKNGPDTDLSELSPQAMARLTQGLMTAARSAGRAGLETYLSQHGTDASCVEVGGVRYRYKNTMPKSYLTLFGEVTVSRSIYANDLLGGGYIVPMDRALGIGTDEYATMETRDMILFAATFNTPEEVASLLEKASLCQPSRTAIQNIIAKDGAWMEAHRDELARTVHAQQEVPAHATALVASIDGTNVRLREPGAKKGRKAQRPRDENTDDSASSFRNAMVASISSYGIDDERRPQRLHATYLARMPQDKAPIFKSLFEDTLESTLARIAAQNPAIAKIFLCDGHRAIWNYAQQTPMLAEFEWCLDFFHATEHLSKAAEAIFGKSSAKGRTWYQAKREALLNDPTAPTSIIRSMEGYRDRLQLPKGRRNDLAVETTFFKNNKHLMRYAEFNAKSYPIGSGPVEAAGKTIIKQRMCRSGMRWNRDRGQHIVTPRTYVKSQQWQPLWDAYVSFRLAA
jgi:hypothetical protein